MRQQCLGRGRGRIRGHLRDRAQVSLNKTRMPTVEHVFVGCQFASAAIRTTGCALIQRNFSPVNTGFQLAVAACARTTRQVTRSSERDKA